jgi:nucleoside phosphorylase
MSTEICFDGYLRSIVNTHQKWEEWYTPTDATGKDSSQVERDRPSFFDFGLMVQTVEPPKSEQEGDSEQVRDKKEKIERLPVLEGICKYAAEHVLLVGRPGSGKSTALARLLLQEAENALSIVRARIPVLVELRYLPSDANELSVCDRILSFMHKHDPALDIDEAEIKQLLHQGWLLLLVDGVNELPSDSSRIQVNLFRELYQKTCPMIFTTRELSMGGNLGITKRLEMQPLTEQQMNQFVRAYLPIQGEKLLQHLSERLRELGQTPLLLWMLCEVFKAREKLPENLGMVFQVFTQTYENSSVRIHEVSPFKNTVQPLSDRRLWKTALKHLASRMMQGDAPVDFRTVVSKDEIIQEFTLLFKDELQPPKLARDCCDDLLNHHLIQMRNENIVEFQHQLIQEYYAAEWLLGLLPNLSDAKLQHDYLNYLKWTEPLALMLELVEGEEQAVRIVRLALEVDLQLGASLAGAVKPEFKSKTIRLLLDRSLPQSKLIRLLGLTHSEEAIPYLQDKLDLKDSKTCKLVIQALGEIPTQATLNILSELRDNSNYEMIHGQIADTLGKIGTPSVDLLEEWNIQMEEKGEELGYVKIRIEIALWNIHGDSRKPAMFKQFGSDYCDQDFESEFGEISLHNILNAIKVQYEYYDNFEGFVAKKMEIYPDAQVIPRLVEIVSTGRSNSKQLAIELLSERSHPDILPILIKAFDSDEDDFFVRETVIAKLGKIGRESSSPKIVDELFSQFFKGIGDKFSGVRKAAIRGLGIIGGESSFNILTRLFQIDHSSICDTGDIVNALGHIGRKESVDLLASKLSKENYSLSKDIIEALGNIGSDKAVPYLLKAFQEQTDNEYLCSNIANALAELNVPEWLPEIRKIALASEIGAELFDAIASIQSRSKYYNYKITMATISRESYNIMENKMIDFAIITALKIERLAVLKAFGIDEDRDRERKGTRTYWRKRLPLKDGMFYEIVVAQCLEMANVNSAILTNDTLHHWQPQAVIMVGIAATAKSEEKQHLGDLVIGKEVYYYEMGKTTADGKLPQPKQIPVDATLLDRVQSLPDQEFPILAIRPDGTETRPKIEIGVIASGDKVISDANERDKIAASNRKILAIEMEGYGVIEAAHQTFERVRCLVIRGLCDYADSTKNDKWHPYAAAVAAGFTKQFLLDMPLEPVNLAEQPSGNQRGTLASSDRSVVVHNSQGVTIVNGNGNILGSGNIVR